MPKKINGSQAEIHIRNDQKNSWIEKLIRPTEIQWNPRSKMESTRDHDPRGNYGSNLTKFGEIHLLNKIKNAQIHRPMGIN